ncbi:hypothetical protein SteCoe_16863 [Stentor coeruleus]|uniref:Uncharacterized protein n=1 Tax=Stentor coeruleus TaxID=5963 RepID=A0A1R2C0B3_9CILI|nr:hypothetical protein SteCoe_16863 [Stentor coeruleus]
MSETDIINFHVTIIGDSGSGKTSIVSRYITNSFPQAQEPTIGLSSFCKMIQSHNKIYRLNIWDAGGNPRSSLNLINNCKLADAFIIACDINSSNPVKSVETWYDIINQNAKKIIIKSSIRDVYLPIIIFINKIDLDSCENHKNIAMIEAFADGKIIPVVKGSALNGCNVEILFEKLFNMLVNASSLKKDKSITLSNNNHTMKLLKSSKKKQKCC